MDGCTSPRLTSPTLTSLRGRVLAMRLALIVFAAATLPAAAQHVERELVAAVRALPGAELRQVARRVRLNPRLRRDLVALRPAELRPGHVLAIIAPATRCDTCMARVVVRMSGGRRD